LNLIRITSGFFFVYPKKKLSKHGTKIVEIKNARFIKNNKVNGSEIPFNIKIQEGRIQVPCVF
jgi:hypothetical protein